MGRSPSLRTRLIVIAAVLAITVSASPLWLRGIGYALVRSEAPFPAEMIVVLAGDPSGSRILKAAELARQGFAPKILVSGPSGNYGHNEADLAIDFAAAHGYARDIFIPLPHKARSTLTEAQVLVAELRRRSVQRFILVTSNYHSRRAGRIFDRAARGMTMRVVDAPDQDFTPGGWWRNREACKIVFYEISKTIGGAMGL